VPMVLTEEEALELLSYLVTAARTQLDEAAEYGSLRLLSAAQRLAEVMAPRATAPTRELLDGPIAEIPGTATRSQDPHGYAAALDQVCRGLGEHLAAYFGVDASEGE
jgi:uncharacterized protein DUF6092